MSLPLLPAKTSHLMTNNKKPRFILVDPSAVHMGGHHYEYAQRILMLAKQKGFDVELWAHKKSDLPQDEFKVCALFQKSFYENFKPHGNLSILKKMDNRSFFMNKLSGLYGRIIERSLPFFMETKMGLHAARVIHDVAQNKFTPVYDSPQNTLKTPSLLYALFYFLYNTGRKIKNLLMSPLVNKLVKILLAVMIVLSAPLLVPIALVAAVYIGFQFSRPKPYQIFASDLALGLKQGGAWSRQDIIFIPTCFSTEIRAMGEFLNNWPKAKELPQLHLLFRTNVFGGYTNSFRDQLPQHVEYRQSFKWIAETHPAASIHYYTDTPQLSGQYKVLSDLDFDVLPVPVPWTVDATMTRDPNKPITIAYVGDVRDEKGYQFYPQIIDALWEKYIAKGKVRFVLQSNFADNLDVSRESAIAQSLLRSFPSDMVRHVKGPLDSDGYKSLITESEIILLTYKAEHYLARSSGIFIEALKAGKAVLMPAQTWMAAELEPMRQARWAKAVVSMKPYRTIEQDQWMPCQPLTLSCENMSWVVCKVKINANKDEILFIELCVREAEEEGISKSKTYVIRAAQIGDDGNCTLMVRLPPELKDNAVLYYKIYGGETNIIKAEIFVSSDTWQGTEDYAAAIYPYAEEKYMITALKELVDNIDAYQNDARHFAQTRGAEFTPQTLVERILENAGYDEQKRLAA